MNTPLVDRHVVVTGGLGGLGGAVIDALLAAGATCHVPVRRDPPSQPPRDRLRFVPGVDLGDEQAVTSFYAGLPSLWSSVHLAGGFEGGSLLDTSTALLRRQFEINLVTATICSREAVRHLRRLRQGGRILNVSSRAAETLAGGSLAYTLSKVGVEALTRMLAAETRADDILVNAIAPSTIDTPANRAAMPGTDPTSWPKPQELARTILWLLLPENHLTSGAIIPVYGRA